MFRLSHTQVNSSSLFPTPGTMHLTTTMKEATTLPGMTKEKSTIASDVGASVITGSIYKTATMSMK
jgi:hypothetical protein